MKLTLILSLFILSTSTFANPVRPFMSMKERLRLNLWTEGLETKKGFKVQNQRPMLKEELEIPLLRL